MADRPDPPALVIAGGQGHDDEIDRAVAEVPSHLRLLRPGYLRYADLPGFLGGALVAAYPSYGEGFGLPILEAMACAAPVLTTPRLSLPEVGGDAVAYTSEDPEQIATDLAALLDDEPRRLALAKAGFDRAKEFTWESSAEVHIAAWSRAAVLTSGACGARHPAGTSGMMCGCSTRSSRPAAAARGCGRCRAPATRSSSTR